MSKFCILAESSEKSTNDDLQKEKLTDPVENKDEDVLSKLNDDENSDDEEFASDNEINEHDEIEEDSPEQNPVENENDASEDQSENNGKFVYVLKYLNDNRNIL